MLEAATGHLNNINQICKFSDARDKKHRSQTDTKYFSTNMFTVIQEMSEKYSELLKKQAQTFRTQIYSAVKYEYLSQISYLDGLDRLAIIQNSYKEARNGLDKKKQKLYEEGNTSKWGNPELKSKDKLPRRETIFKMLPK